MTTGLQRTRALPFPSAISRGRGGTSRVRSLRVILVAGRLRAVVGHLAVVRRRTLVHRSVARAPGASPARTPRARDAHDAAVARGIAPPF